MSDEITVGPADIARLAGVGRAAVSNWRRRHPDFPEPVGGTPASPLFQLTAVESWLRDQGKLEELPAEELAWQCLRAEAGDDLKLAEALATVGDMLLGRAEPEPRWEPVLELSGVLGVRGAFEFLFSRFRETQARRAADTPPETARLMADLVKGASTVFDPACGTGELLLAVASGSEGVRLLGQDADPSLAHLAGIRLALGSAEVRLHTGDSLLADGFPGVQADAVVCDPPFHQRAWGHDELIRDPRWEFGLPPRLEPELAWAQHALAHLTPEGVACVLLPSVAAGRRPGRRIRAQLLRRGALRAVVALSPANHLWLLRRPDGGSPATVLMIDSSDPETIVSTWRRHRDDPSHDVPGVSRAVPLIELIDEEVDLTPARYLSSGETGRTAERYTEAQSGLAALIGSLPELLPDVTPGELGAPLVPVSELARIGHLTVFTAPLRRDSEDAMGTGVPLLTAEDVLLGRTASGLVPPNERWITTRAGDVVVAVTAGRLVARVLEADGALLGPQLSLLRVDPAQLDPHFVAGVLGGTANVRSSSGSISGPFGRAELHRARIPRLPLDAQRGFATAFQRLAALEAAIRAAGEERSELARLLADGIAEGTLLP